MSQYSSAFADPHGPGDARPAALQIIADNGLENKLVGKTVVITGGHSGLGFATTRALLTTGLTIYLTARDVHKAQALVSKLGHQHQIEIIKMDQCSLESVRSAAKEILRRTSKINILINNAGIMAVPSLELTEDGNEKQFQTNHLSHFLLFLLLKPALMNAIESSFASRVVNVSASAHRLQGINDTSNYNWQSGGYSPWAAYAQSKTANIYMANEIERRFGSEGLHASSLHPGIITETGIGRDVAPEQAEAITSNPFVQKILSNVDQGAATTVWAAVAVEWEGKGGKYLVNCTEAPPGPHDGDITSLSCASHTYNADDEARLWKDSATIVGIVAES